jgi:hypothetical protein
MISNESLDKTVEGLRSNNFNVIVVDDKLAAKNTVETLLEVNSEVMQMTSQTLIDSGIAALINESGKYKSIKAILMEKDDTKMSKKERTRLASVPDYAVGSVHAVTEKGELFIASQTGSQLPAYAYGTGKVIFVVGVQKLVADFESAIKRIYEYVLPLESERARKAYGTEGSSVNKMLIINKEVVPGRITVIIVKEDLGF